MSEQSSLTPNAAKVAVMGSGSWGTVFAKVLCDAQSQVNVWGRRAEICAEINTAHTNSTYLPGVRLPDHLRASTDQAEVLREATIVVCAVPATTLRENLVQWRPMMAPEAIVVSLAKAIEAHTLLRMSQVIADVVQWPASQIAVVSGPNLAREIAAEQPTATVVASENEAAADALAHACSTSYFRPYTNPDVVGVEVGGAVKNVIALAVGMAEGLGLGDNSKASIITRGLAETTRLAVAMGGQPATMAGLAGLGDLVATCSSALSRNRTFGVQLGQGLTPAQAMNQSRQTVEGVRSCLAIQALAAKEQVEMPIVDAVVKAIHHDLPPRDVAALLLSRARKSE